MYYNNLRGVNSKILSLRECIGKEEPHVICVTETKLDTDAKIKIEGYEYLNHKNNKAGEGGIIIGCSQLNKAPRSRNRENH